MTLTKIGRLESEMLDAWSRGDAYTVPAETPRGPLATAAAALVGTLGNPVEKQTRFGAEYSAAQANRTSEIAPALCRVVGKHCEGGDILVHDVYLPGDIRPGDLVAVPASGAYSRAMASNYNHTPRPPVVAVRDGQLNTLLRRETIEDLLALDVGQ